VHFPWIKRQDLVAVPHDSGGWVVKDPLTLHYAYLDDVEFTILNFMDGKISLVSLMERIERFFPDRGLTPEDLSHFIRSLAGHQLIRQLVPGDSQRLGGAKAQPTWLRIMQPLFRILRIQVPLMNPSTLLTAAMPFVRSLARPWLFNSMAFIVVAAFCLAMMRFHEIAIAMPTLGEFLGAPNLVLILCIFVTVKVFHEAGHAVTARMFGADCHEVGVMLMVFTPVLYTNVTDAWMLRRRERMWITAGGIAVELVIASVCLLLWSIAAPGTAKSLLLNTTILCSVNTLLFNGNPLLRFDGYFLLADALRIPNLAARASAVVQSLLRHVLTGRAEPSLETRRNHAILLCYGVLAAVYRVFLTLAILQLVREVTKLWNLQVLGSLLTITIVTGFLVIPLIGFVNSVIRSEEEQPFHWRQWMRPAICLAIVSVLMLIPLPQSVVAPAFVQSDATPLYTVLPGQLQVHHRYGEAVQENASVVTLQNSDLALTGARLHGRFMEIQKQLEVLESNSKTANSELIPTLNASRAAAEQNEIHFLKEQAKLTIRSPTSGIFQPPIARQPRRNEELPELWTGEVAHPKNRGAWVERGTLLGYVGEVDDVVVRVCVSEDDIDAVAPGQPVEFLLTSGGATPVKGTVREVSTQPSSTLPESLMLAGLLNGRPLESGIEPIEVTYLATVVLTEATASPKIERDTTGTLPTVPLQSIGRVRIATKPASIVSRIQRFLRRTF